LPTFVQKPARRSASRAAQWPGASVPAAPPRRPAKSSTPRRSVVVWRVARMGRDELARALGHE